MVKHIGYVLQLLHAFSGFRRRVKEDFPVLLVG